MSIDDEFERRKFVLILTRQNYEVWFRLMKIFLKEKDFWKVTKTLFTSAEFNTQLNVKTQYHFICCIDIDDKKLIADLSTIKDVYLILWKKYNKKLKITDRQYVENWITYKKSSNKFIEKTWIEIDTMIRKIKKNYSDFEIIATMSFKIQFILKCLSNEYMIIRDTLDAQNEQNHEMIIQKLQKKKAMLKTGEVTKTNEIVMYVKRHHRRHFFSSDISMSDVSRNKNEQRRKTRSSRRRLECFICDSSKHEIRECSHLEKFKTYVKKRKIKNERIKKKKKEKHKHHALVVENEDHFDTWTSDFDLNDLNEKKLIVISKKMINSISADSWIVDSDAFTSMTDNLQLFRNSLKSIKRRVIKIGEERLYSDKCDLTCVRDKKSRIRLITTLYVSNLEVNLLSMRRLCEMKLKESFDENVLYMRDRRERLVLRTFACNDVYIIDKITKKLNEIVLIAVMIDEIKDIDDVFENDQSFTSIQYWFKWRLWVWIIY